MAKKRKVVKKKKVLKKKTSKKKTTKKPTKKSSSKKSKGKKTKKAKKPKKAKVSKVAAVAPVPAPVLTMTELYDHNQEISKPTDETTSEINDNEPAKDLDEQTEDETDDFEH